MGVHFAFKKWYTSWLKNKNILFANFSQLFYTIYKLINNKPHARPQLGNIPLSLYSQTF